jgi:hypothetical protein
MAARSNIGRTQKDRRLDGRASLPESGSTDLEQILRVIVGHGAIAYPKGAARKALPAAGQFETLGATMVDG